MSSSDSPPLTFDLAALASDGPVSRFELERYVVGELPDARRAEIAQLLERDVALRAAHDELVAERQAFFAMMPRARFEADHAARRTRASSSFLGLFARLKLPALGTLAAAAAALVLVVVVPEGDPASRVRLKGDAHLGLFVKEAAGAHLATDGEQLVEGDRVQFVVKDADRRAMVIVGVDGRGAVTVYEARALDGGTAKGPERARLVDESVILDDATGAERFFVVYADVDAAALSALAERAGRALVEGGADLARTEALPLDVDGAIQSSIHIQKVSR